jgi:hypothetical protein
MKNTTRRVFVMQLAAASSALGVSALHAQAAPMVDSKDPQANALGYAADTTKVDPKKFPKHAADQKCSGCQLYTGKAKEPSGPCALFAGKHVNANGWCSAYVKKA